MLGKNSNCVAAERVFAMVRLHEVAGVDAEMIDENPTEGFFELCAEFYVYPTGVQKEVGDGAV
ncbi:MULTISPECIES: hypothetical protein [unclassified Ruegeria]|uniref:hypothetical protein n=1 Tax=unclassified Ruegeria TaxID=2625375 RepID=UPI0014889D4C|nr:MULTISPECIES: hypothetical protein [unclassified Ruegeria]